MDGSKYDKRFIASHFSLPLFMLTRNRIKFSKQNELRRYIKKRNNLYDRCLDKESERATLQYLQHIVGSGIRALANHQISVIRNENSSKLLKECCQLPPNLYDTKKIPYESKRGLGGAYWSEDHSSKTKRLSNDRQQHVHYYSTPNMTEILFSPCNRFKGVFLTNARERRATTRCMVSNAATCYRNPSDPGPATYHPTHLKSSLSSSSKSPNPHLFYRSSIVPVKCNSIHTPHTSFTAAPGRYETRYRNTCPCSSKLIYQPQIDLRIEKEKRKKFRRLPYEKIKAQRYTSPDWRHVRGRGFRYLFKGAKALLHQRLPEQEIKTLANTQLHPDSKYLAMINNPLRTSLSLASRLLSTSMPHIRFNCIIKIISRKQLRNNKKIAFNSSQERFQDEYRLPILTKKQQEMLKQTLPVDRQFREHPIMNKRQSEIESKLNEVPRHMLPNYIPKLRKKIFKFQPLPQAKVLVTENDINIKESGGEGFFLSLLNASKFFKETEIL